MSVKLHNNHRRVLRSLCDTFVPSLSTTDDPAGFWARSASNLKVDKFVANTIEALPPELASQLLGLLDALESQGFVESSQSKREFILRSVAQASPAAAQGVKFFEKQTLLINYGQPESPPGDPSLVTFGSPDAKSRNPNWEVLGYPGPLSIPKKKPKEIQTITPTTDQLNLEVDVCVVGSGAGGGVIAARLSQLGFRVLVLEAGGYFNSSDFHQLELWSYRNLWYRGGATPTANGTVNMLAGATLGGGTEVNWMNCIRTPDLIRADWAKRFGLDGVDSSEFDQYLNEVESRLKVNSETAHFNGPNSRMREGCQRLGYLTRQTRINWDPQKFDPLMAGYTGLGDQSGAKQTGRRTYLKDAFRNGAQFITHCRANRIITENGVAAGVEAEYSNQDGQRCQVRIRAKQVVVACGSIESPALLLRSGIGGPNVGKNFRLQPGGAVYGVYDQEQRGWWGSPMTANCEEFVDTGDGYGFYMEIPAFAPGFYASVIPWSSGRQHKELMQKVPFISTFIWFLRDKGHGQVTIDDFGNAVPVYEISNETDQRNFRKATETAVRIHHAAGAKEIIFGLSNGVITWKKGQNLEKFIENLSTQALLGGAQPIISAHQMCSCRMGNDPATSVADTNGELRDVRGVWIGDASACPTSLGANPMITIMALARRTAERIANSVRPAPLFATYLKNSSNQKMFCSESESRNAFDFMVEEALGMIADPLRAITFPDRVVARLRSK